MVDPVQEPRDSREEVGFENLHVFDDPQGGAGRVTDLATGQDNAHFHRSLTGSVRWDYSEKQSGKKAYPVDVSEGEEGKEDRGEEWGDIHAASVGVGG